jgi:hypothetical protein
VTPKQTRAALVVLMASGGPVLFGLDLVAQSFVLDGQPEDVTSMLSALVTRFAWGVVPFPVVFGVVGFLLYPRLVARQLRSPSLAGKDPNVVVANADLTSLMFAASLPQLPALLGDLSLMLGASKVPVACSTTISVVAVLFIALFARRPKAAWADGS